MFEIRKREKQCLLKSEERQTEAFSFCPEETFFFLRIKAETKPQVLRYSHTLRQERRYHEHIIKGIFRDVVSLRVPYS